MRKYEAAQVLFHQTLIEVVAFLDERVVLIAAEDEHLTMEQCTDAVSQAFIFGLDLTLEHKLSIPRQLRISLAIRAGRRLHRTLELLGDGFSSQPLADHFFLEVGCPPHEWSRLTLDHGKIVRFLEVNKQAEGPLYQLLIEDFDIKARRPRLLCLLLHEELLLGLV